MFGRATVASLRRESPWPSVGAGPEGGVVLRSDVPEGSSAPFGLDGSLLGRGGVVVVVRIRGDKFGTDRDLGPTVRTRSRGWWSDGRW